MAAAQEPTYYIRRANLSDTTYLTKLINSAYRGESSQKGWTTEANLLDGQRIDEEMLNEILINPDSTILLLESHESQNIVACVHLKRIDSNKAYLGLLTVNPMIQNKGYGRILLDHSEAWVKNHWQSTLLVMTVISTRSELIEWYQRRGYLLSDKTSDFPMDNPRFGLPKVKIITFVELTKNL